MSFTSENVAAAFVAACEAELAAPKPGNVHVYAPGHGMEARHFIESAQAAAGPLCAEGASVGERIHGAVEATWERVGLNTNLGIILLGAPLAHAALHQEGTDLRARTAAVLARLDQRDAELAFRAISLAKPAGLGDAPEHDVRSKARTSLADAMRHAASRDRIAFQYANDFEDVFVLGAKALQKARARGFDEERATLALYMAFLTSFPDSHVVRKLGADTADEIMAQAREISARLDATANRDEAFAMALQYDRSLKRGGANPGTSADLTVAALFANYLCGILRNIDKNG